MTITTTRESTGHVLTCTCGWVRWETTERGAAEGRAEHGRKCKGPREGEA